ncbi:MFS transporter [Bacillus spongiae]|uniref:MFS transporter n=1 Tax=Bacillus spongiae TaxID=2683610 RepID=A0ABU8HAX3_9BACI
MRTQTWLSYQFFSFFFTWGVFMPFWTAWLVESKGFSIYDASTLIAVSFITRSLSTFFIFPYISKWVSLTKLSKGFSLFTFIILFLFLPLNSFESMLGGIILLSLIYPLMMPLTESTASILMKNDHISYGKSRLWGSIGYTVALLVTGIVIWASTEDSIFILMLLGTFFMMFGTFFAAPPSLKKREHRHSHSYKDLFVSKEFMLVLLVCILLQGSHASYYNYGVLYLQELQISSIWIGVILNIAVLAEIVFFAKSDAYFGKVPVSFLLVIASMGTIIRWSVIYAFPYTSIFILSQVLHAVTFGVAHYAFIRFINDKLDQKQIPSAQGIYASIGMGLTTGLLSFFGGYLYEIEPVLAFLGMSVVTIPCLVISIILYVKFK